VTILPSEIVARYYSDSFARLYSEDFQFRTNLVVLHARDLEMTLPARTLIDSMRDAVSIEP
jgi:hypothetical protein